MGHPRLPDLHIPSDPALLAYVAGLLDGEGCIRIHSSFEPATSRSLSHSLRIGIANTDERLMLWLSDTFGGGLHEKKRRGSRSPNWKPCFDWSLHSHQAEAFLRSVEPYLVIKKAQAQLALRFRDLGRHRWKGRTLDPDVVRQRTEMKQHMHLLNKRGVA